MVEAQTAVQQIKAVLSMTYPVRSSDFGVVLVFLAPSRLRYQFRTVTFEQGSVPFIEASPPPHFLDAFNKYSCPEFTL